MSASNYMLVGFAIGLFTIFFEAAFPSVNGVAVLAFSAGCLFGKGYGIFEERERNRKGPAR